MIAMYGATIGKLAILGIEAATNQACAVLIADQANAPLIPWAFHYLRAQRETLRAAGQGGAQPNISQAILKEFPCPIAPLAEQRRIVAKLEALLSHSRHAKEALDAIPGLLEQFRQSVLAAAFRGDLTAEWRKRHPDVEPASKLLERIRVERRQRWEAAELERMRAKGKVPKDNNWKARYEEPGPVDEAELPDLPHGWCWAWLDELRSGDAPMVYGIILPGDDVPEGVPYVRPIDIADDGGIVLESLKRTTREIAGRYSRSSLNTGDVILSIVGTIGKVAIVPQALDGANITQSSIRVRPGSGTSSAYLGCALQAPPLKRQYDKYRFGNAVQRLNVEHVRQLVVPLAPFDEQAVVVARVEAALSTMNYQLVEELRDALNTLDRALLAKAFRGELVEQDPNDEPAAVMLERLRTSRDAGGSHRATAGRPTSETEPKRAAGRARRA